MFLKEFFIESDSGIEIPPQLASRFAKEIANDFNPLHDADAKKFCVPGDLLFALVLHKYGLSQKMHFEFSGMVGRNVNLIFPATDAKQFSICDDNNKVYQTISREGLTTTDEDKIAALIRKYVEFSGHNFPFIMMPLLEKHGVMLNPERPLVIYESMDFDLISLDFVDPELSLANNTLEIDGKRGNVVLHFEIKAQGKIIGEGNKKIVIGGLRDYDQAHANEMSDRYLQLRQNYINA